MEVFYSKNETVNNLNLIRIIEENSNDLNLQNSVLYSNYPFFLDEIGELIETQILIISKYGIFIIWVVDEVKIDDDIKLEINDKIEQLVATIQSKLMINRTLRGYKKNILQYINPPLIFTPVFQGDLDFEYESFKNEKSLIESLKEHIDISEKYEDLEYLELRATVEGSKPLKKNKKRKANTINSKGNHIEELEKKIALFDRQQRIFFSKQIEGPTRIRGLAGSGKTIILTMKAALIHLSDPEANIIFTFWTKSLYQQITNWIKNFYLQYSNGRLPNWNKIQILHGWGSQNKSGLYRIICNQNGIRPLSFSELKGYTNPFDKACKELLKNVIIKPKYDFILIDEGQDFPPSFIQMCDKLSIDNKFILAYDDQQSIFQSKAPNPGDIFGYDKNSIPKRSFKDDYVLHKVYRNPREILVCAHALGFGIYSGKIVQVIDDMAYWNDIGYNIIKGEAKSGSMIEVERPESNSINYISSKYKKEEIIKIEICKNLEEEIEKLVTLIKNDIEIEGLNPSDILVIAVNDYTAKQVLKKVCIALEEKNIKCNNVHSDPFNLFDFYIHDRVTVSTIHKAKGNEAYSVYILSIEFLFENINLIKRNRLFTGMTRSKAWITLMGIGKYAEKCKIEISKALSHFPKLVFKYPSEEEIKRIKRELSLDSIEKIKNYRKIEKILEQYGRDLDDEQLASLFQDFIKSRK